MSFMRRVNPGYIKRLISEMQNLTYLMNEIIDRDWYKFLNHLKEHLQKEVNDEKKIMGIITESSLLEVVSKNSFKEKVKNNITKVKKIDYQFDLKKIVNLIMKEKYLFVYKNNFFHGVINKTDILWYLKKKENNA